MAFALRSSSTHVRTRGAFDWNLRPLTSSSEQDEDEEEDEELSADPSHYRYEFYTTDRDGQLWEVKLDAETGKILSEEKKTEID